MMFKIYLNENTQENFLFSVKDQNELREKMKTTGLMNSTFVIRNDKGEPCNMQLQVIPSVYTSMESMVGLLKDKFSSKK